LLGAHVQCIELAVAELGERAQLLDLGALGRELGEPMPDSCSTAYASSTSRDHGAQGG
jgi:hypothetical protein